MNGYCQTLARVALEAHDIHHAGVLCMANSSDIRRRVAFLKKSIPAIPLRRLTVYGLLLVGLITTSFLSGIQFIQADEKKSSITPKEKITTPGNSTPDAKSPKVGKKTEIEVEFIINDENGQPVPKGLLKISGRYAQGNYNSKKIPFKNGRATMMFTHSKLSYLRVIISAPNFQSYLRDYQVQGIKHSFPVENKYTYQLKKAVAIGGTVFDEYGKPFKDVSVFYNSPALDRKEGGKDYSEGWLRTDQEGKWSTSDVAPDLSRLRLHFESLNHVHDRSEIEYALTPNPEEYQAFLNKTDVQKMKVGPFLEGTVVNPKGEPISQVLIEMTDRLPSSNSHLVGGGGDIRTNEKGIFHIPRPPEGDQSLRFSHPDWDQKAYPVKVPSSEPIRIVMHKGRRIEFRAIDTKGNPIKGMRFMPGIRLSEFSGKTDSNGRWVWENAPKKVLHYQITHKDYLCQLPDANFGPKDSPITLTFRERIPVIGKVVDAETGESIKQFQLYEGIHFKRNRPGMWTWSRRTSGWVRPVEGSWAEEFIIIEKDTAIDWGLFATKLPTLDRLIQFRVQAEGYLPQASRILDAAKLPDDSIHLEFRLKKNIEIQRTILTPEGKPASNAQVAIIVSSGRQYSRFKIENGNPVQSGYEAASVILQTDSKGGLKLPVIDDLYACVITHDKGYLELKDFDFADQHELKLNPWALVEGRVFIQGKPAGGVELSCYYGSNYNLHDESIIPSAYFSQSTTTDETGKFRFAKGTTGLWEMTATKMFPGQDENSKNNYPSPASLWSHRFQSKMISGETVKIDIGNSGADVIGRLKLHDGKKFDSKFSYLNFFRVVGKDKYGRSQQFESYRIKISEDGSFIGYNFQPGEYQCSVNIFSNGKHRWYYLKNPSVPIGNKRFILTKEMFKEKSITNPIDLGEMMTKPYQRDWE